MKKNLFEVLTAFTVLLIIYHIKSVTSAEPTTTEDAANPSGDGNGGDKPAEKEEEPKKEECPQGNGEGKPEGDGAGSSMLGNLFAGPDSNSPDSANSSDDKSFWDNWGTTILVVGGILLALLLIGGIVGYMKKSS